MTNRLNIAAGIVCVIAGLFLSTAKATTVIPPTFEQLADRADLVFVGKVVGSRAEWRSVGTDRVIFTLVEFETAEVLKGNAGDRKSTRLNSSHLVISYAVFCLKKKNRGAPSGCG